MSTGLAIKAAAASGLQCTSDSKVAMITIQEGYKAGIMGGVQGVTGVMGVEASQGVEAVETVDPVTAVDGDTVLVTFMGIPEGVSVMVPAEVPLATDVSGTSADEEAESFRLVLVTEGRTIGIDGRVADGMAKVLLSAVGAGSVAYSIFDASAAIDANEWAKLPVTFGWTAAGDMPAIGSSHVNVSFNPVSNVGGDTFENGGAKLPRFVASNDPDMVVNVGDCTTSLLFPYVTNKGNFDTGLVITNTSEESGSCTIEYNGADAPDDMMSQPIAGGAQWVNLVSAIATGFQGYMTATCGFRDAYGFAFVTDGFVGTSTRAHGYLAVCTEGAHCKK